MAQVGLNAIGEDVMGRPPNLPAQQWRQWDIAAAMGDERTMNLLAKGLMPSEMTDPGADLLSKVSQDIASADQTRGGMNLDFSKFGEIEDQFPPQEPTPPKEPDPEISDLDFSGYSGIVPEAPDWDVAGWAGRVPELLLNAGKGALQGIVPMVPPNFSMPDFGAREEGGDVGPLGPLGVDGVPEFPTMPDPERDPLYDKPIGPELPAAADDPGGSSGKVEGAGLAAVPVDETPVKPNKMNAVQRWAQDKMGWDEDKRSNMSEALMTAGFAMMAGDSPYAMQNIGAGGLAGVEAYQGAKDQDRKQGLEDDAMAMQEELHKLKLAEAGRAAEEYEYKKSQRGKDKGPYDHLPDKTQEFLTTRDFILATRPELAADPKALEAAVAQYLGRKAPEEDY